jgi:nitric oxide reductase subunit B
LLASEFWVFMNLVLALFMSIPAINRYTHGTHITVAHAMGTTIGINSMILLGSISYLLKMDKSVNRKMHMNLKFGYWVTQISLIIFWLALIIAGIIKGYQMQVLHVTIFSQVMAPVLEVLKIFVYSGITLVLGITIIVLSMLRFVSNAVFNTADEL